MGDESQLHETGNPGIVLSVLTSIEGQGNWGGRRPTFDPPEMKTWMERISRT